MVSRLAKITIDGFPRAVDLARTRSTGWQQLRIGGGGYVTGLHVAQNTMYARTDVGGAYRYDQSTHKWTQLVTATGITTDRRSDDYDVEALSCSATTPSIVYMAVGSGGAGRVLVSTDGGTTWPVSSSRFFYAGGNETGRVSGNRIAVDPDNASVAYLGTRKDGLWYTTNGGTTWAQLTGLPAAVGDSATTGAIGSPVVRIDPTSAVVSGRHQGLYVSVFGVGLLTSTDGGANWTTLVAWTVANGYCSDLVRDSNGNYVAAFYDPALHGKVKRITSAGVVTDIAPKDSGWLTVAVHPTNPDIVFIAGLTINIFSSFYRTKNGTTATPTWSVMGPSGFNYSGDTPWLRDQALPGLGTSNPNLYLGQLRFLGDDLYFAEGDGVFRIVGLSATTNAVTFEARSNGIEELVSNHALKPKGKPLLTVQWDYGLLRHPIAQPAQLPYTTTFGSAWDLAVSPTDPNFVVAILDDHQDPSGSTYPARRASGYSQDGGQSWTRFPQLASSPPSDLLFGNIAVSAGNNSNIVWVPSRLTGTASKVYYSTDKGSTFTAASLPGLVSTDAFHTAYTYARHVLVANPNNSGVFYLLGVNTSDGTAVFWSTTNGGATWTRTALTGLASLGSNGFRYNSILALAGTTLFAVPNDGGSGFYRSADGGATWVVKSTIAPTAGFGVGAAMPGTSYPALYCFGTVSGTLGFYRSTDQGETWTLLSSYPQNNYAPIRTITGDPETPGKVYVGLGGGTGFAVGQFN